MPAVRNALLKYWPILAATALILIAWGSHDNRVAQLEVHKADRAEVRVLRDSLLPMIHTIEAQQGVMYRYICRQRPDDIGC